MPHNGFECATAFMAGGRFARGPIGDDRFVAVPPGEDGEAFVTRIENRFIRIAQPEEWPQHEVVAGLHRDAYPH